MLRGPGRALHPPRPRPRRQSGSHVGGGVGGLALPGGLGVVAARGAGPGSHCVRCAARRARFRGRPEALGTPPQACLTWRTEAVLGGGGRGATDSPGAPRAEARLVPGRRSQIPEPRPHGPLPARGPVPPGTRPCVPAGSLLWSPRAAESAARLSPRASEVANLEPVRAGDWNQLGRGRQIKAEWKPAEE